MLPTPDSSLGPCLQSIHSLTHQPQSGCLQPSAQTHPESTPLPKVGECRAWDSRDRELWGLERTVNKEISRVCIPTRSKPRDWYVLITHSWP